MKHKNNITKNLKKKKNVFLEIVSAIFLNFFKALGIGNTCSNEYSPREEKNLFTRFLVVRKTFIKNLLYISVIKNNCVKLFCKPST